MEIDDSIAAEFNPQSTEQNRQLKMSNIILEESDGVATITLNRPEKLNAFAGSMREELFRLLLQISSRNDIGAVIITGAGRGFCAGGDVEYMHELQSRSDGESFQRLLEAGANIVTAIRELPQFVIAAVNGVAAGAGCNLALACDYRIASSKASFGETFVRIGLHPDWGGTWFLPRLVGASRALEMCLTGRMVSASEALEIGLADRVVEVDALMVEATSLARSVSSGPQEVIRDIKKALGRSWDNSLSEQLVLESDHQSDAFRSDDARKRIAEFVQARRAQKH
jgi:2-(1,2-epoxy-1,2-dihydrophenyl)acetyl-CoA isomerase